MTREQALALARTVRAGQPVSYVNAAKLLSQFLLDEEERARAVTIEEVVDLDELEEGVG